MTATTISVNGDREFVRQLRLLAVANDMTIGALVREALDEKYRDKLPQATSFITENGSGQNVHTTNPAT